jgi:4-hydroxyphenylpyruvate dioxygenase
MRSLGFTPLRMTDNYYRDVAARFDLDKEAIAKLRSHDILYDEDAQGAFYQYYSRPFGGGLFFEIVQRVNGYDGYGAANAPFRIAAQKRVMGTKGMPKR